ncbi:PREDICTED: uncharacterized protein LOC104810026 isoform X2 [Tarenaya hassleriana]|uniref:uncharacterized protein LOC104810026 isoform X2 n=1 Tax=Tarenaya hassleriana TaxID=28532 RepID=UPI00053C5C5D|nr:PREDICTED: uncharacterized protein LOC104810026 isoform X2 [Tarenaya hassleriana]
MNTHLASSMTRREYGSDELQMPSWDMSMQMYTDGNLLANGSSTDTTLFNSDNQHLHYSYSFFQPHTGYDEMGSSSHDGILRDSALSNLKLSIPYFKSEFPYPKRIHDNDAMPLTETNGVKKTKTDVTKLLSKVSPTKKNNKLSEKITILQKLVSPYGKADIASVLEDTSLYIKLLQQQIQGTSEEEQNLRSKGLCLVPMSFSRKLSKTS